MPQRRTSVKASVDSCDGDHSGRADRTIDAVDAEGMMAPMPTFTASRRAVVATALGLVLSISLIACSPDPGPPAGPSGGPPVGPPGPAATLANRYGQVGCSMTDVDGFLVAENGRVVLVYSNIGGGFPLDLPDGLTVRTADDGELEIVDGAGTVRARTGESIKLYAAGDPVQGGSPWVRDGELVVCNGSP
jgi:hypothetical protein